VSQIKAKIVKQLEELPENTLQQVSDFIDFLTWRKTTDDEILKREEDIAWLETDLSDLGEYEPYEWEAGELEQGLPVEIDPEKGVVTIKE
jgi:hypothetical protein